MSARSDEAAAQAEILEGDEMAKVRLTRETMYQVIYRTPDNSDGIYDGERLVISAHTLWRNGYEIYSLLFWKQSDLARLIRRSIHWPVH